MLSPEYLLRISEGAEQISEQLHRDIIDRIVERIMYRLGRGDNYILTAQDKWQIQSLLDSGYLMEDIQKEIASATKLQQDEIAEAMEDAGVKALDYDDKIYESAGISTSALPQSPELVRIMQRNYEATMGEWKNFTRTMANASQQSFIRAMDKAYNLTMSGAISYTQAVKEAINDIISDGVIVEYPSGRKDSIETATLRAVRTGVSQASAQIQIARMDELDIDLVLVSSHMGARPSHQVWQGKVYSRTGNKYPDFVSSTGYGTVTGLCGANCRHNFSPYFEGMDNPFEQYDSEENKKVYEQTQKQRELERRIRKSKREVQGLQTAVDNCKDEKLKFELQQELDRKSYRLQQQNKAYKSYCEENNLKPLNDRLQIAKWDRKQAAAARGAAKRYENAKTSNLTQFNSNDKIKSGAKSGALTSKNDPDFKKREEFAKSYYREVLGRKREYEIEAVSKNSGFSKKDIDIVFSHVFELNHLFKDGTIRKFAPDYDMAQSWIRLREGKNIQEHDIILLKHELEEANIMGNGTDVVYDIVHSEVEKKYNYSKALRKYLQENNLE